MSDDQTNPFTVAGMAAMMQPNKYINAAYRNQPLPIPGYMGTPTDAQGKPIQSFTDAQSAHDAWSAANPAPAQGTTLNSTPQSSYINSADRAGIQADSLMALNSMIDTGGGHYIAGPGTPPGFWDAQAAAQNGQSGGGAAAAGSAGGGANPVDMRQAYLTALSNPGKVTTPGATVPQAQPLGTPSVLDSFMAAHPGGGGGPAAGNYSNAGFFDTLRNLRSA